MITDDEMARALDRISQTADGELLYRYFQRVALSLPEGPDLSDGALRLDLGRRSLARELMARLQKGVDENAARYSATRLPSEQPVVFGARKPVRVSGPEQRSARARILASDPELTDYTADSSGPSGGNAGNPS